jgi:hypothetical protein
MLVLGIVNTNLINQKKTSPKYLLKINCIVKFIYYIR